MSATDFQTLEKLLRSQEAAVVLKDQIAQRAARLGSIRLMEVCGTHTVAIRHHGLLELLPENLEMISGPGCPVCVTPNETIDRACAIAQDPQVILTTFGDLMRVPGSWGSLAQQKTRGADVRVVYSPLDSLRLAQDQPKRQVVFVAVGFETTAPLVAHVASLAKQQSVSNFSLLVAHKTVPPALQALVQRDDFCVQGFLLPGHVSAIIGWQPYRFLIDRHLLACAVAGFEPVDILLAISSVLHQLSQATLQVAVPYQRVVRETGNATAQALMSHVFAPQDSQWRGLGSIPNSGLGLRPAFAELDATTRFPVDLPAPKKQRGCRCADVLVGALRPNQCALFAAQCTPATPMGACMVSSEGACAAFYHYRPIP